MRVGTKIGGGFALISLFLILTGISGYWGAERLTQTVDFLTSAAWDTADGSMEISLGAKQRSVELGRIIAHFGAADPNRLAELERLKAQMAEELAAVAASGIIAQKEITSFSTTLENFNNAQADLLKSHTDFTAFYGDTLLGFDQMESLMGHLSIYRNQLLEEMERELTGEELVSWTDNMSARWEFVKAIAAIHRGVAQNVQHLQHLLAGQDEEKMRTAIEEDNLFLEGEIYGLIINDLMMESINGGAFDGLSYGDALIEQFNTHQENITGLLQVFDTVKQARRTYLQQEEVLMAGAEQFKQFVNQKVTEEITAAAGSKRAAIQTIFLIAFLGIVIAVLATWFVISSVVQPIGRVAGRLKDIAEGEGDLAVTLNVRGRDEIASLAASFNQFVAKIRDTIANVAHATEELSGSSSRLSVVVEETNQAVGRQKTETHQMATALQQLSASVQEVARNAVHAAEAAQQADLQSTEGKAVVSQNMVTIQNLSGEVLKTGEVINELKDQSESIGSILDVIRSIADQTNLLALNAAIEAARAGEHGRGFAVVADEVRNLAGKTQDSTEEIQALIVRLQEKSSNAVQVMQSGSTQAEESVRQAEKVGASLQQITDSIATVTNENSSIANVAEEQSVVAAEIEKNVCSVSALAETTKGGTMQTQQAASDMNDQVNQLQALVGQFKIK